MMLSTVLAALLTLAQPSSEPAGIPDAVATPDSVSLSTVPIPGDVVQIAGIQGVFWKGYGRYDDRWPSYSILHVDCEGNLCTWGKVVGYVTPDTKVTIRRAEDGAMLSRDVLPYLVGKDVVAIYEYVGRGEGEASEQFALKLDILVYQDETFTPKDRPDETR